MSDDFDDFSEQDPVTPIEADEAPTLEWTVEEEPADRSAELENAAVVDASLADRIQQNFEPTVETKGMSFVVLVDGQGRLLLPPHMRRSGALRPGMRLFVQARIIEDE